MDLEWRLDDEGDWKLNSADGRKYFGMVCPHRDKFTRIVAIMDGWLVGQADTVAEAKQILREAARKANAKA
jgi:hypothetical protein